MEKQTIFSSKELRNKAEVGEFLIKIGEKLRTEGSFNLTKQGETINISPKGPIKLELDYKVKEGEKHELEIEIEWKPNQAQEGKVDIS